ncbi:uncharacterized protein LOC130635689 [Hydractinia symbiolongicarpus]|uniref:uncharacterized protein LOC130635689 n=1 Tax=Hydractinia symbiolongicarpus TaxID=13093 RepID=UPI00254CEAEB|nr:uncharacterized protein LOC130635689 [Hydractinia symbiolongicarpus]
MNRMLTTWLIVVALAQLLIEGSSREFHINSNYANTYSQVTSQYSDAGPLLPATSAMIYPSPTPTGNDVMYPYGSYLGDSSITSGDDYAKSFVLSSPMPLFSTLKSQLYICTNGYITVDVLRASPSIRIPADITVVAPYAIDLIASYSGTIYYRESYDSYLLNKASKDVNQAYTSYFRPNRLVIITYFNVQRYGSNEKNTFQLVLASDGYNTYAIFNYNYLESSGAVAGYTESGCDSQVISNSGNSRNLMYSSNMGVTGRHAYHLNGKRCSSSVSPSWRSSIEQTSSPTTKTSEAISSSLETTHFIKSSKESSNVALSTKGILSSLNPSPSLSVTSTMVYPSPTPHIDDVMYPYGSYVRDSSIVSGDDTSTSMALSWPLLLFTQIKYQLYISTNGYVTVDTPYSSTSITIPFHITVMAPYAMDLVASYSGPIYYRESYDSYLLNKASKDVYQAYGNYFRPNRLVVITYLNVQRYNSYERNTFQLVLASDGYNTYAIFNYKNLQSSDAVAGYSAPDCESRVIANSGNSRNLMYSSNMGVTGRHVYHLNGKRCSSSVSPSWRSSIEQTSSPTTKTSEAISSSLETTHFIKSSKESSNVALSTKGILSSLNPSPSLSVTSTMVYPSPTPHIDDVMYPYGSYVRDSSIVSGDDTSTSMALSWPLLLFTQIKYQLYISTNGYVTVDTPYSSTSITIPFHITVMAPYAMDLVASYSGPIYYRESYDSYLLNKASKDVYQAYGNYFRPNRLVVITYLNVQRYNSYERNTFQLVLASDGYNTYAIFNYKNLQSSDAVAGYSAPDCESRVIANSGNSRNLMYSSNMGVTGRHVYHLNGKRCSSSVSPSWRSSIEQTSSTTIKNSEAISSSLEIIHSSKLLKESSSVASSAKGILSSLGPTSSVMVTSTMVTPTPSPVPKEVLYPYGSFFGDRSIVNNYQSVYSLSLSQQMPLFGKMKSSLYIDTKGYILLDVPSDRSSVTIPYYTPVIAPYAAYFSPACDGPLYYRETYDAHVLSMASNDVRRASQVKFQAKHAVVITYHNYGGYWYQRNTFQLVLASDDTQTFAIFNYKQLHSSGAVVGFSDSNCMNTLLAQASHSQSLMYTSNVGFPGRHVYQVSDSNCSTSSVISSQLISSSSSVQSIESVKSSVLSTSLVYATIWPTPSFSSITLATSSSVTTIPQMVMYPYGSFHGDRSVTTGDDHIAHVILSRPIPFLSKMKADIYISTNGIITADRQSTKGKVKLPFYLPVIAPYSLDMIATNRSALYYRESTAVHLLNKVNQDVHRISSSRFKAQRVIIITYENFKSYMNRQETNTFQVVLATNEEVTYAVFNYKNLQSSNAVAGFSEPDCQSRTFLSHSGSRHLMEDTNINIKGRQVYLLTKTNCLNPVINASSFTVPINSKIGYLKGDEFGLLRVHDYFAVFVDIVSGKFSSSAYLKEVSSNQSEVSYNIAYSLLAPEPANYTINILAIQRGYERNSYIDYGLVLLHLPSRQLVCVEQKFARRMSLVPAIKLTGILSKDVSSDYLLRYAFIWVQRVTTTGVTICGRKRFLLSGTSTISVNFLAVAGQSQGFAVTGIVSFPQGINVSCRRQNFKSRYLSRPHAFVSAIEADSESGILTWINTITAYYIEICMKVPGENASRRRLIKTNFILKNNIG